MDLILSGYCDSILLYKLKKGVHQMDTLNRVRAEQQERNAIAHEKAMAKSPWIRESVQAFRNATPEQLAQVEAIVAKRAGK